MTPTAALVAELTARGVALRPDGERLRVSPAGKVTPAELDILKAHKAEVLKLVAPPSPPEAAPPAAPSPPVADLLAAFTRALNGLWTLNTQGPGADRVEIKRLLAEQARLCDELGAEFALAVSRQASRDWSAREGRCAYCGLENVYHDPDSGEELPVGTAR